MVLILNSHPTTKVILTAPPPPPPLARTNVLQVMRRYVRPHRGQQKTSPLLVVRRMITEKNESLEPRSRNAESQSGLRMMMNLDGLPNGNENSMMSRSWKICPRRMVSPLRPCIHNSLFSDTYSEEGSFGYANRGYPQAKEG